METLQAFHCIDLPRRGPVVGFDVRLGEKVPQGMILDFSERQFRLLCQSIDPSVPNAADYARITITRERSDRSYHHNNRREMEVQFSRRVRRSNATLRHETSHFLEEGIHRRSNDTYYEWARRMRTLGFTALWVAVPAGAVCVDVYAFNAIEGRTPPGWLDECTMAAGALGITGVGLALPYWLHPSEVRARYMARRHTHIKPLVLRPKTDYEWYD